MNPQDVLRIRPSTREGTECTPPDCLPIPPTSMMTQQIDRRESNMVISSVDITFTPAHNHGGYRMTHCFQVSDSCAGGCERNGETCPGMPQSAIGCVVIQVERCQFTVRKGQELQQIAAIYHTDWLQLWSHNQQLLSPDVNLEPGSLINIGHVYAVQPFDTPAAVGQRFGMTPEKFNTLNADVGMDAMQMEVCTSVEMCSSVRWCILPDSCDGQSGSIYQEAYADQPWFARAKDSLSTPPRPGTFSTIPAK